MEKRIKKQVKNSVQKVLLDTPVLDTRKKAVSFLESSGYGVDIQETPGKCNHQFAKEYTGKNFKETQSLTVRACPRCYRGKNDQK